MINNFLTRNAKPIITRIILAFFIFSSCFAKANDSTSAATHAPQEATHGEHDAHADKPFDPTEVIFEHISDAHEWHLWGDHHNPVSIPLPVILYSDKGIDCFMSSAFHHGETIHQGKYSYKLIKSNNKIKIVNQDGTVDEEKSAKLIDLSITQHVASMLIGVTIILFLFFSIASSYKKQGVAAPRGVQSFIEPLIIFVRDDIAKPNIGQKAEKFLPYLLTIFFFIWVNNLLGLLPSGANFTGNISVTLSLSFITLLVTNINGNKDYWKHILLPPVPWWLYPIMIPVELIGVISKPFALMIRLFANITAGHIIIISLISLIFIFKTVAIAPVSIAFGLFMDVLELLVAFLQAYIFTMLTALFIGTAVAEHEHEHDHHHEHAHH
jgi:F-type H+-transporting ATPase subunit a